MKRALKPKNSRVRPVHSAAPLAVSESDSDFLLALGKRVREVREQRGMARKALSAAADISERYLAALETGEGNASIVLLRRVAKALGLQLADLLEVPGTGENVRRKRITLIGLRGAGKTTLGSGLAKALNRPFVELDAQIEREAGMSLSEIFLLYGQEGYRRIERRCLERVIQNQEEIVLAVGGGIVSEPETFNLLLLNCFTVWIKAAPAEHMSRVLAQGDTRPMAGHEEAMKDLKAILSSRASLYGKSDAVVDTSGTGVKESLGSLRRLVSGI